VIVDEIEKSKSLCGWEFFAGMMVREVEGGIGLELDLDEMEMGGLFFGRRGWLWLWFGFPYFGLY